MHKTLALLVILAAATCGRAEAGWRLIGNIWQECAATEDSTACLKGRALSVLDRAVRSDIPLAENVVFQRTRDEGGRALTEEEVADAGKTGRIEDLVWDRLARFMRSHVLKVQLPEVTAEQMKADVEEGRGKMKKMMGSMMMMGAMKAAMIIPLVLGGLFLLAGKAFVIAKIALILSLIITLKKLLGSKQEESHGGGHGGGGWDRRSGRAPDLGVHDLVYSGYKPSVSVAQ